MDACFLMGGRAACDEQEEDIGCESSSPSTSRNSIGSSSSSELDDDASSSSSDRFETSSLMTQLPIKRGLSRFFDGKSQSFTSLAAVRDLEDLAKPPRKRLKLSRSCEGGLDARRGHCLAPRSHCKKATGGREVAGRSPLSVLAAMPRRRVRPAVASPERPDGLAGKALLFT